MPRFFMHICDGGGFAEDQEGSEHPDAAAAREAAIKGLRDVMAGELRNGQLNLSSFIEVEDERRTHLFTVTIKDAVVVMDKPC
jgi:hypothetical protein